MGLVHVPLRRRYQTMDCLQYLVDNKCPRWEMCAEEYAEHLR